ncbi:hypothetical protein Afil01_37570 [Actinorhabdospora filicis]|uniref:Aminoglycoside phosphotransferase domain-containing protein n=1 Tax=Actinorhabdospora filicis TaxID=1785913 RepID=A0A9W6WBQ0_9ACTN|nr:phosphotransferase [Actinorhabdospora filicis]GLZ78950.1 hypothetical protein Afil01_37570 [Actinorhabdospora filicis]
MTATTLAELARRHGFTAAEAVAAPVQGVANHVHFVGGDLVVRVAREGFGDDLRKEAAVIPAAGRAGVPVPEIVDAGELDGVPYMLQRRVPGEAPPLPERPEGDARGAAYRDLGAVLARLHAHATVPPGVPAFDAGDPTRLTGWLTRSGRLGAQTADWLAAWLDRLGELGGTAAGRCLLHGDAGPANTLARDGRVTGLLDWGDACAGDPAADLAKVPPVALPYVLDGYRPAEPFAFAARVLRVHLHWAVGRFPTPPDLGARHWSAQPGNRVAELLRLFALGAPSPWRELGPV